MKKYHILIIDDSAVDRKLVRKIIEGSNKDVTIIENETGCDYEQQILNYDIKVIILDLMLKNISGIDILKNIKENQYMKTIPVIICSSIESNDIIRETLTIGAFDYFEKPLSDRVMHFSLEIRVKNALEMKIQADYMIFLRNHDELTGLKTRKYFETVLNNCIEKKELPLSVIILDINGLKVINDAYGHDIGDLVLKEISDILINLSNKRFFVARWGSDEMVILLPDGTKDIVQKVIEDIKQKIEVAKGYNYDVSFGWATEKEKPMNIKNIVQKAEDNLYSNKLLESGNVRSKMIESIINTLHEKNPREEMHSYRVSDISGKIATTLGFSEYEIKKVKLAGLMHDIGKIAIDEDILNKPGKLDEQEWLQIKKHPEHGFKILSTSVDTMEIAKTILAHHERWDGKGYPKGLSQEDIPIMARIIAVADTYDAMTSIRTYRKSMCKEEVLEEIKRCSGTQFDSVVVQAFMKAICFENHVSM